ncbi:MAG: amino-acid N-acetyltransferase [Gammaproteobacteria bacterium]|nr:amino-acid N-acetyltransferase [Gammaproteobacteria bacterium]
MINEEELIAWFRASTSYINAHRGKTFVIHLGGDALAHHNLSGIIHDLTLLHSLGVKLVLVHGARPHISAALAEADQTSVFENGLRITEAGHMETIKSTVGRLSIDLQASFSMGLSNSPMYGANITVCHGNYVTAKPYGVVYGIDYHLTGKVRKIQTENVKHQLNNGQIVLLSNLGHSLTGEVFNLSAEEVATEVAVALDADKLIMFTPGGGLLDEKQQLITTLNAEEAERLIKEYSDGDERKNSLVLGLSAALRAYRQGVPRSHLVSYEEDGVLLLELFTKEGRGTLLSQDTLEELRTAGINDVGGILNLIRPLEEAGALVERSRDLLETEISNFLVIELEGTVIGCAALYPVCEESGEIACIAIHPDYRREKLGGRLLSELERKAEQQNLTYVYALTTVASHFFLENGFVELGVEALPNSRKPLYNYQRNSKILKKQLKG